MASLRISRLLIFGSLAWFTSVHLPQYLSDTSYIRHAFPYNYSILFTCLSVLLLATKPWKTTPSSGRRMQERADIYGLQHGRLHLQVPTPMWMNMGYWDEAGTTKNLAHACRDLLKRVLAEAGFWGKSDGVEFVDGSRRGKMLIDIGVGCGDQSVYLMSMEPVRACDEGWWDAREHCVGLDQYIGITNDAVQARYAAERVEELRMSGKTVRCGDDEGRLPCMSIFCADAARPLDWSGEMQECVESACRDCPERWVLALDTAYHFSPSRWLVVEHAHATLHASFMAFDLCLSPSTTFTQRFLLRVLTWLMGAPFANFVTPEEYHAKLVDIGYSSEAVKVVDISERVFAPLAQYLDEQDRRLKTMGLGIGRFGVAKALFKWWGKSGVVKGVVVVAKQ